jgi:phosphoglycerate dehydrogenase-like enzyme
MREHSARQPAIFIATQDADDYRERLVSALGRDAPIRQAGSAGEVVSSYAGEPVVLGRPDYLARLLSTRPPVRWAQSTWAGVTPLVRLDFKDYLLTGVKGVFGPAMAEYVFAYLLAHEIRLVERQASQQARRWDPRHSGSLRGRVLGVLGTGSIGRHLAETARHFAMVPLGFNTRGKPTEPFQQVYSRDHLAELLARCDYLVGVLPDTPATTNLLDESALAALKPTALLVNVGRGSLIDEAALCRALQEGRLAGAVLDVFQEEPLPIDSPLWHTPNLQLTGHIAAVSSPQDITRLFLENYRRFCAGEPLQNLVDFQKGY